MKPARLALYSTLGMLSTGAAVYVLTPPGSAPKRTDQSPHKGVDGGIPEAPQVAPDASSPREQEPPVTDTPPREPVAQVREPLPSKARPASTLTGFCSRALTDLEWNTLLANAPQIRQLPAEKQRLMRSASAQCQCGAEPSGHAVCVEWCASKGFRSGHCNGQCTCFN